MPFKLDGQLGGQSGKWRDGRRRSCEGAQAECSDIYCAKMGKMFNESEHHMENTCDSNDRIRARKAQAVMFCSTCSNTRLRWANHEVGPCTREENVPWLLDFDLPTPPANLPKKDTGAPEEFSGEEEHPQAVEKSAVRLE